MAANVVLAVYTFEKEDHTLRVLTDKALHFKEGSGVSSTHLLFDCFVIKHRDYGIFLQTRGIINSSSHPDIHQNIPLSPSKGKTDRAIRTRVLKALDVAASKFFGVHMRTEKA